MLDLAIRFGGSTYNVSIHALDRYIERIRSIPEPTTTDRLRYSKELTQLVKAEAAVRSTRPSWVGTHPPDCERTAAEACAWILIADDIALPVVQKRSGDFIVVTCMTRGGLSEYRRGMRNKIKADKRKARRSKRAEKAWRGERTPRWR